MTPLFSGSLSQQYPSCIKTRIDDVGSCAGWPYPFFFAPPIFTWTIYSSQARMCFMTTWHTFHHRFDMIHHKSDALFHHPYILVNIFQRRSMQFVLFDRAMMLRYRKIWKKITKKVGNLTTPPWTNMKAKKLANIIFQEPVNQDESWD